MGRTNIEIDDGLILQVMERYRLHTKRAAVDLALRRLVDEPLSTDDVLALAGFGWEGDLDTLRSEGS